MVKPQQTKAATGCCSFTSIITLALFLILGLWTLKPTFTITKFTLTTSSPYHTNQPTITFTLKLHNRNFNKRVYYDSPINLTIHYDPEGEAGAVPIGGVTFPPFTQGLWKTARKEGSVRAKSEVNGSAALFRVDVTTAVRYTRMYFWKSKRHGLQMSGEVEVGEDGRLVKEGGVRLRRSSGVRGTKKGWLVAAAGVVAWSSCLGVAFF